MNSKLKSFLQVIIFGGIGVAILYFMWQANGAGLERQCVEDGLSGDQCRLSQRLLSDFRSVHVGWLSVVVFCYLLSGYLRAVRWRDMLSGIGSKVSRYNAFAAVMIGYFVNLGVPRLGEVIRPSVLTRYEEVTFEKALGTIVLERIVDVILFAILIGLGFLFHFDTLMNYLIDNINISGNQIGILIGIGVLLGVIGLWILVRASRQDATKLSGFQLNLKNKIDGFTEGLLSIKKLPSPSQFVFQSIFIWMLYFVMHWVAFYAFAPTTHLSIREAILVFDFGALGIVLPAPGGMGTFHFLVTESLHILGVERLNGFSFAMILFFTINIGCNALFGFLAWMSLPIVNRSEKNQ